MAQNISVIGTGYVGLVSAIGLSDFGNHVIGVDINASIVAMLKSKKSTIFEHGIEDYLERNLSAERLEFTTDIVGAINASDVIIIAVGTPARRDGKADLSQVKDVVRTISRCATKNKIIVTKSTVPVGTNRWIAGELKKDQRQASFDVVSNPEFLREGKAIEDFFHPNRIVVGCSDDSAKMIVEDMYRPLHLTATPFVWCNWETAELIKYASNAFLATKITFINQIANLCEECGADITTISKDLGMDERIGPKFLHPGPGYGGSCLPKDTRALVALGASVKTSMSVVEEVIRSNESQKDRVVQKMITMAGGNLSGKTVAVLGLAFKSETDDIRESPALEILSALGRLGAHIKAHDPKAIQSFRHRMERRQEECSIKYCDTAFDAIKDADCILILTEWNEYRNIDLFRARRMMKGKLLLDTRNLLRPGDALNAGFYYQGTGRNGATSQ